MEELNPTEFETHVPVPSKEEMEQRLLEEKKRVRAFAGELALEVRALTEACSN